MVMWQDLNGGRCSMGDACSNPPDSDGVVKMLMKNFDRHYGTNRLNKKKYIKGKNCFELILLFFPSRAPFGLFYHAAWFTQPHHKEGFIKFLDIINGMNDVWLLTNWQALQWVRDPTPISRINSFQPFQCDYSVNKLHNCSDTTRFECVEMGNGRFLSKKIACMDSCWRVVKNLGPKIASRQVHF